MSDITMQVQDQDGSCCVNDSLCVNGSLCVPSLESTNLELKSCDPLDVDADVDAYERTVLSILNTIEEKSNEETNPFHIMQQYVTSIQSCRKCGICFQNRTQIYRGKFPYCRKCRPRQRENVIVFRVRSPNAAQSELSGRTVNNPRHFVQYVIPSVELFNVDLNNSELCRSILPYHEHCIGKYDFFKHRVVVRIDL